MDHVGDHFHVPTLDDFTRLWISLFSRSHQAKAKWKQLTGTAMCTYSETRWWSRWEVLSQLLCQFGDVIPFLRSHPEIAPTTRGKLLQILEDPECLGLLKTELATIVDVGEQFVKATYTLEGDGALAFKSYAVILSLVTSIQTAYYPNLNAIAKVHSSATMTEQQLIAYGRACVQPVLF